MYATYAKTMTIVMLGWTLAAPAAAFAHTAKQLDHNGCHDDRRRGDYHCHTGPYAGLKFSSEGEFNQQVKAGKTVAQMREEQGLTGEGQSSDEGGGWLSHLHIPFIGGKSDGMSDVGSGDVIMPRGIEERLKTLKNLHDKGLIADDEYATKRKEILGEL